MGEPGVIRTAEQWKAFSHPLRLGILRLLGSKAMTNEELATALGVAGGKLHFHTRLLLRAGLIEPDGTRQKGPITEKLYRTVSQRFSLDPGSVSGEDAPLESVVSAGLALYRESCRANPGLTGELQLGYHYAVRAPKQKSRELALAMQALVEDFITDVRTMEDDLSTRPISFTILLHPFEDSERVAHSPDAGDGSEG